MGTHGSVWPAGGIEPPGLQDFGGKGHDRGPDRAGPSGPTFSVKCAAYLGVDQGSVGDTSRNIIEMIFRATWLSPGSSIGKIERVLKVNNSPETLERFEQYRETVKSRAEMLQQQKGNPRSVADGNELLRFHSTTVACCPALTEKLSGLCRNAQCGVCRVIQSGFTTEEMKRNGIRMTATGVTGEELLVSKKAEGGIRVKRAVVVCRVIAGRVLSVSEGGPYVGGDGGFDSLVVKGGLCSKWGDLYAWASGRAAVGPARPGPFGPGLGPGKTCPGPGLGPIGRPGSWPGPGPGPINRPDDGPVGPTPGFPPAPPRRDGSLSRFLPVSLSCLLSLSPPLPFPVSLSLPLLPPLPSRLPFLPPLPSLLPLSLP
ncbi:hypothetical protein EJ110_NYTH29813 [Nymphaea thermarum]|nr:hypothetical protein EJ110_NYTH29813 [Nymphaea thermarum]